MQTVAAGAEELWASILEPSNQVKQLADQTARATDQIGKKFGEIQGATGTTVKAISRIVRAA